MQLSIEVKDQGEPPRWIWDREAQERSQGSYWALPDLDLLYTGM